MTNILIADSGSTKTTWGLIEDHQKTIPFTTPGINPFYMSKAEIAGALNDLQESLASKRPDIIYFYGAGCTTSEKKETISSALQLVFQPDKMVVESDLLGAARALCQNQPGIASILGTGSNSCYYDGTTIVSNVSPLGYILGDEGSGAVIGRQLIADILKNQLPPEVIEAFFDTYCLSVGDVLDAVYKKPFPNRYLAQFTTFISQNIHIKELEDLVVESFDEFIRRNLFQYGQSATSEIHFTGSIAFAFYKQLKKSIDKYHLRLGRITKSPMEDLIAYHIHNG